MKIEKLKDKLEKYEKIPLSEIDINEVDELSTTSRGENGFGTSGK